MNPFPKPPRGRLIKNESGELEFVFGTPEKKPRKPRAKPEPGDCVELQRLTVGPARIATRKGASFIAVRKWREPTKKKAVDLMKRTKDAVDMDSAEVIAGELTECIRNLFGASIGASITAPNARHSAHIGVEHFASKIAQLVAAKLGAEYVQLFEVCKTDRSGHSPKLRKDPPKIIVANLPASRRVIIVDEVATSAETMEMHIKALREAGISVSGLVWVFGETNI